MTQRVRHVWAFNDLEFEKMISWCIREFGIPGQRWDTQSRPDYMDFLFVDDRDAEWFILRWGGLIPHKLVSEV